MNDNEPVKQGTVARRIIIDFIKPSDKIYFNNSNLTLCNNAEFVLLKVT